MINLASSISIKRPAGAIFDFISSPANDMEWQYGTVASGVTSRSVKGLGATFRTIGHLMGRRVQGTFEVTRYDANCCYGFKSLTGPLQLDTQVRLAMGQGGTRVKITTQAARAEAIPGSERALERYMQKQLREDLASLREIMEAPASRRARAD